MCAIVLQHDIAIVGAYPRTLLARMRARTLAAGVGLPGPSPPVRTGPAAARPPAPPLDLSRHPPPRAAAAAAVTPCEPRHPAPPQERASESVLAETPGPAAPDFDGGHWQTPTLRPAPRGHGESRPIDSPCESRRVTASHGRERPRLGREGVGQAVGGSGRVAHAAHFGRRCAKRCKPRRCASTPTTAT